MKTMASICVVLALCVGALAQPQKKPPEPKPESKGIEVKLDGMSSIAPASWVPEKPANLLRAYQFRIPHAEGDKHDAEIYVLKNLTGSTEDNITRLKDMFVLPPEMPKEKAITQSSTKLGKANLTILDIQGTYLLKHIPIDKVAKETRPDYRMIAVIWQSMDDSLGIRLIGPKKTVEWHAKEFHNWIKNFK